MRTKTQLFHYLLSFDDVVLFEWYNTIILDQYGDYRDQIIRDNIVSSEEEIKSMFDLEVLCDVLRNQNTRIVSDDKYIAICGGDAPYIITFNSFEEFMKRLSEGDCNDMIEYALNDSENIEELERIAKEKGGK